jgi:hypothetical protein
MPFPAWLTFLNNLNNQSFHPIGFYFAYPPFVCSPNSAIKIMHSQFFDLDLSPLAYLQVVVEENLSCMSSISLVTWSPYFSLVVDIFSGCPWALLPILSAPQLVLGQHFF